MSQKYSFLIIVESNGTASSKIFKREDAQFGLDEFAKAREDGKEAYFYHFPKADKRCKSEKDMSELDSFSKMNNLSKSEDFQVDEKKQKSSKKAEKSQNLDI